MESSQLPLIQVYPSKAMMNRPFLTATKTLFPSRGGGGGGGASPAARGGGAPPRGRGIKKKMKSPTGSSQQPRERGSRTTWRPCWWRCWWRCFRCTSWRFVLSLWLRANFH